MKILTVDDFDIISPYLKMANYEGYNSNFNTMIMWNHEYHILYEVHENFVVMLHNYKGTLFWSMPFTSIDHYKEAIEYMLSYSKEHHFDFVIECATEEFINDLKKFEEFDFLYERTDFNDDYIYERDPLQYLTGKKMQKRRNHYNAFIKQYPNYEFRDLDGIKDFDIILKCLMKWEGNQGYLSESITSEIYGIMTLLSYQKKLDYNVSGIFIDNVLEAFIIGSRLNRSTIQIHVEKADKNIRGLYPVILKEFLMHHYPDDIYINREEDMGLENLRKAKKALNPIKMIKKYHVHTKHITITKASSHDEKAVRKLWMSSFEDETKESSDYFFKYHYPKNETYLLKNNNEIISMLQLSKMNVSLHHKQKEVYFILGVATHKNYQGQGYMRQLLEYVLDIYKDHTIYLQAYNPSIYNRFGFYASHYLKRVKVNKDVFEYVKSDIDNDNIALMQNYYHYYVLSFNGFKIRNYNDFKMLQKRCIAFGDKIAVFEGKGYMIYHVYESYYEITEIVYLSHNALLEMIGYLNCDEKDIFVICDLKAPIDGEEEMFIEMMSNKVDKDTIDDHMYINEIY